MDISQTVAGNEFPVADPEAMKPLDAVL